MALKIIKYIFTISGAVIGQIFGAMDGLFFALLTFIILDYITGVINAIIEKKLNSEVGFRGILKKITIFLLVAMGNLIDVYILKIGASVRTSIIFFYIANEGISILENVSKIGIPIPEKLQAVLEQINKNDIDKAPNE